MAVREPSGKVVLSEMDLDIVRRAGTDREKLPQPVFFERPLISGKRNSKEAYDSERLIFLDDSLLKKYQYAKMIFTVKIQVGLANE